LHLSVGAFSNSLNMATHAAHQTGGTMAAAGTIRSHLPKDCRG
jgi:hypothetical protein